MTRAKMMSMIAIVLGLPLACAACSAPKPVRESVAPSVKVQAKFDYSEHEPYAKAGRNVLSGRAFLRQQGDSVVTCAGNRVLLVPATAYFREAFWHLIVSRREAQPPETVYPSLKSMIRRAECDAEGKFSFSEVPDGAWFVLTQVNAPDGGVLIGELALSNAGAATVLLTDKHLLDRLTLR
jgi:hypothetical protein